MQSGDEILYEVLPDNTVVVRKTSPLDFDYLKALSSTMNEWESEDDERSYKTYDLYEIVKVPFPFSDIKASKVRPALILSSARSFNAKVGLSIMTMITSVKPENELWPTDVLIEDLENAGLPAPSIIRFKLFTLDHRLILGRLGLLSDFDCAAVQKKLQEVLSLHP